MIQKFKDAIKRKQGKVTQKHPSEEAGSDTAVPNEGPLGESGEDTDVTEVLAPTLGSIVETEI